MNTPCLPSSGATCCGTIADTIALERQLLERLASQTDWPAYWEALGETRAGDRLSSDIYRLLGKALALSLVFGLGPAACLDACADRISFRRFLDLDAPDGATGLPSPPAFVLFARTALQDGNEETLVMMLSHAGSACRNGWRLSRHLQNTGESLPSESIRQRVMLACPANLLDEVLAELPLGHSTEPSDTHLAQAWRTIASRYWHGAALQDALDALPLGILFARSNGEVTLSNRSARLLLADFIEDSIQTGRPVLRAGGILRNALETRSRQALSVSTPDAPDSARIFVQIEPVSAVAGRGRERRSGAIIMARRRGDHALPSADQFRALFGLSDAEGRLATALLLGNTLGGYAAECALSIATVRTQLRSTLAKTRTQRQAELISVLLSIPPAPTGHS